MNTAKRKNRISMSDSHKSMGGGFESSASSSTHSSLRRRRHRCHCDVESPLLTCKTLENYGRRFYGCGLFKVYGKKVCSYFHWLDEEISEQQKRITVELLDKIHELEKVVEHSKVAVEIIEQQKRGMTELLEKKEEDAKRIMDELNKRLKLCGVFVVFSWVIVIVLVFALVATQLVK